MLEAKVFINSSRRNKNKRKPYLNGSQHFQLFKITKTRSKWNSSLKNWIYFPSSPMLRIRHGAEVAIIRITVTFQLAKYLFKNTCFFIGMTLSAFFFLLSRHIQFSVDVITHSLIETASKCRLRNSMFLSEETCPFFFASPKVLSPKSKKEQLLCSHWVSIRFFLQKRF